MKTNKTSQFYQSILCIFKGALGKQLVNLLAALSSFSSESVTDLSTSVFYKYHYSMINKTIRKLYEKESLLKSIKKPSYITEMRALFLSSYLTSFDPSLVLLQIDTTPIVKMHSPVLKDRHYISTPNPVLAGDRGIKVGYDMSFVNLSTDDAQPWSLPLSNKVVPIDQTASQVAADQLEDLLAQGGLLSTHPSLKVAVLDSSYFKGDYFAKNMDNENLVSIIRIKSGLKLYAPPTEAQLKKSSKRVYGDKYYLITESGDKHYKKHPTTKKPYKVWQDSLYDRPTDELLTYEAKLKNDRAVIIEIRRWNDLLFRTRGGVKMADKPCDLLAITVRDATSEQRVFSSPLFIGIWGKKRGQIKTKEGHQLYIRRYGIEPFNAFVKRRMHLNDYQALSDEAFQYWPNIVTWACWSLYLAKDKIKNNPKPWQKGKPIEKNADKNGLTIFQAFKGMQNHLSTLDWSLYLPRKSKPGKGRQKGDKQPPRTKQKWSKKKTGRSKKKQNSS